MAVSCVIALACILTNSLVASFILDNGYRNVNTKYGEIVGHVEIVNFDGRNMPVSRFLGIPYAEPPVGDLRFRKPVPVTKLASPYAAHTHGHSCIQADIGQPEKETWSEDCLSLNIFAPSNAGKPGVPLKPVMIYIHGGGFLFDDSKPYEGDVISGFADVITVTMNYRLGPIGFFSTHDEHARGNYGLWDQNEAILWVKNNIVAFGGDANNMTIFGQSAGGASVFMQMMYSGSKSLFNQAIIESGALAAFAMTPRNLSYNSSMEFAAALGCNNPSKAGMMQCVRSKSTSDVMKASAAIRHITLDYVHPVWVPVYDGQFVVTEPSRMLQEAGDPSKAAKYPAFKETNLLLGVNSYDGLGLLTLMFGGPKIFQTLTESVLKQKDIPVLLEYVMKHIPSTSSINAVIQDYVNGTRRDDFVKDLIRLATDVVFVVPAVRTAMEHDMSNTSSTYLYQFSVRPPHSDLPMPEFLKNDTRAANHGDELLYLFGFVDAVAQFMFNFNGPISARDLAVSKFMMTTWTNFAKTGDPNSPVDVHQAFNISWPSFTAMQQAYLDITDTMSQDSVKMGLREQAADIGQPEKETWSEDCLSLNIFAPSNAGKPGVPLKPVMIYIHGGGFLFDDSKPYEGDVISGFADVITVTMNYRLGPIGFFSTHDEHARGNYGLWDQNEAILWVKNNIVAFGGDANNMTIFGQSAGGASVFMQMMYPGSKSLFNQAIIESGALAAFAMTPKNLSYNSSMEFAAALGCNNPSKAGMMQCVRSKSTSDVMKASAAIRHITLDYVHPVWVPVYDGQFVVTEPSRMLQEAGDPSKAAKYPAFKETNLLLGVNSYDGLGLLTLMFGGPKIFQTLTESVLKQKDIPVLLEYVMKHIPSTSSINAVIQNYVNGTRRDDFVKDLIRLATDVVFVVPAVRTAMEHDMSNTSSTYLYQFSVRPPHSDLPMPEFLKNDTRAANHGDELLYLFGFVDAVAQFMFNFNGPISARDLAVSKFMMTTWTNFAKTGDPNSPVDVHHAFNVSWPSFTAMQQAYLDITDTMSQELVKMGLREQAVRFWSKLLSNETTV